PVQAYIAAMPGWKRDVGRRLDALIVRTVPGVRKAVKWNSPLYGVEGRGWFLAVASFKAHLKLVFFDGASLTPVCVPSTPTIDCRCALNRAKSARINASSRSRFSFSARIRRGCSSTWSALMGKASPGTGRSPQAPGQYLSPISTV
ncbi:MAG: DUF1801 domain-containing protein, partial [Gammaproteobacteria bacterium]